MLYSIKGKVCGVENKNILVETKDFDFEVLVSKPKSFIIGEYIYLYLYHVIKEDDEYLVGFRTLDEKNAFKLLLNVQGIGPKSALNILGATNYNDLLTAISNDDFDFIKQIPGISDRVAYQILLDLKQFIAKSNRENSTLYKDVKEALKSFKFKVKDIERVLPSIYLPNASRDELLKEALRRLGNNG